MSLSSLAGLAADLDDILAQSRGDAGEVEPIHALEDLIPIKVGGLSQLDGAVGTVVDADGTTLRSTLLVVVDANAIAAAGDHAGVNAVAGAYHIRHAVGFEFGRFSAFVMLKVKDRR